MRPLSRTIWVVGLGGLAFILVLGIFVLKTRSDAIQQMPLVRVEQSDALSHVLSEQLSDQDRDGDGLRDWEENLWGTNTQDPDTDGDGTSDGDEVDQNRNPTVAGPDDELDIEQATHSDVFLENLNTTDVFARKFFSDYLSLRQSGEIDSAAMQSLLLSSTVSNESVDFNADHIISSDIHIVPSNHTAIKTYGNTMGAVINQHSLNNRNEGVILLEALETEDREKLKALAPIQMAYANMRKDAEGVFVPETITRAHLELVNSFARLEATLVAMQRVFDDPLVSLSAIGAYQDNATKLALALLEINQVFEEEGVSFDTTEPGYLFPSLFKK